MQKLVSSMLRKVKISKHLLRKVKDSKDIYVINKINEFKKIEKGENINSNLSCKINGKYYINLMRITSVGNKS